MKNNCGLYIHIPFCSSKCLYCDFYSKADSKEEINTYVDHMLRAAEKYGKKYSSKIFDTIYIGGGTPSVIGTNNLYSIIAAMKQQFKIISPEITVEMNPCSARKIDFERLRGIGVNRISLGVQSANENELKKLGRIHRNNDVKAAVEKIKSSGIDNISLDLMIGIPEQTTESLKNSIDFCIELKPKHISAYILKIEENTPFKRLAPTLSLPNEDTQADFYEYMQNYLSKNGFEQYEISNFAQAGYESRHNIKYWQCDEYLGLGPSAHSMMNSKRFYFPRSISDFYNNKTVYEGEGATSEEFIMLSMRLKTGLIFKQYTDFFHRPVPRQCIAVGKKYERYGYTRTDNASVSLTPKGFLVSNAIIAEMLE